MRLNSEIWGPRYWFVLHTISLTYPKNPPERIKKKISIPLEHGDIYIMNFKASGNDWKSKKNYTLRHATGCENYIK